MEYVAAKRKAGEQCLSKRTDLGTKLFRNITQ